MSSSTEEPTKPLKMYYYRFLINQYVELFHERFALIF